MSTPRISLKPSASTPAGALAGAAVASILAGVLVFSAMGSGDSSSAGGGAAPVSVIVADRLIPKGSSGEAVAAGRIARPTDVRSSAVTEGALRSISDVRGQIAIQDIYPGEQLTAADFKSAGSDTLTTKLTGSVRGISIPLDEAHGLVGQAEPGDHVDVYASLTTRAANGDQIPVLKPIATNIEVLATPEAPGAEKGDQGGSVVTLRMAGRQAAQLAFASDNGKVWMVLRPPTGAVENSTSPVTLKTLMTSGKAPIIGSPEPHASAAKSKKSKSKSRPTTRKKGN